MLTPTRTDTNSLFITEALNSLGIDVASKSVVGDDLAELAACIALALDRHPLLILTGGLGPTEDDLTRDAVAAHLGLPLDEDPAIVETIRARFAARGIVMPDVNRRQAMVPRGARVLDNPRGSAPGLLIEHGARIVVLLPGPPREMRPMMSGPVRERLAVLAGGRRLLRRMLRLAGRSESQRDIGDVRIEIEEAAADLLSPTPSGPTRTHGAHDRTAAAPRQAHPTRWVTVGRVCWPLEPWLFGIPSDQHPSCRTL